ncbi:MAG TPA: hypothetical protein PKA64_10510 [Myxococcota bacterium]|nr:hypothetical protein [Myxococcota bacterium]
MRSVLLFILSSGCQPPTADGDDTDASADVPPFSADVLLLTVGDPTPDVATADWQDALDGWTYAYTLGDEPTYVCQHDQAGTEQKYAEWDLPTGVGCAVADPPQTIPDPPDDGPPPTSFPPTHAGLPGRNPVPPEQEGWTGAEGGGCGTWSIAMCDRILGRTDPTSQVTEPEWDTISEEIHLDPTTGSSNRFDRAAYYQRRGYCVAERRFDGTPDDYAELVERFNSGTCDIKAMYYKRLPDDSYVNGHVEAVVGASNTGFLTNSWGHLGIVEGGSQGGFHHSGDGDWMTDEDHPGEPVWPPGSTEVIVQYVCPCTAFEQLGRLIFGG